MCGSRLISFFKAFFFFFLVIGLIGFNPDLAPKRIEGGSFFAGFLKTVVAVF